MLPLSPDELLEGANVVHLSRAGVLSWRTVDMLTQHRCYTLGAFVNWGIDELTHILRYSDERVPELKAAQEVARRAAALAASDPKWWDDARRGEPNNFPLWFRGGE